MVVTKTLPPIKHLVMAVIVILVIFAIAKQTYVLPIHIGAFFVTITGVIVADVYAGLWVLGKIKTLPRKIIYCLHIFVAYGLLCSVVTGLIMFWDLRDYLLSHGPFWAKTIFVFVLIINSFVISKHIEISLIRSFQSLTQRERVPLIISGLVSTVSWIGAFVSAQFLGLS